MRRHGTLKNSFSLVTACKMGTITHLFSILGDFICETQDSGALSMTE